MISDPTELSRARRARAVRRFAALSADSADKVLRHDRYWSLAFTLVFLDGCRRDCLDRPRRALALARQGVDLIERVRVGDGVEDFPSEGHRQSWKVHALAVRGEAARSVGRPGEATAALRQGYEISSRSTVLASALADLELRQAALLLGRGDTTGPLVLKRCLDLYRRLSRSRTSGGSASLSEALLLRAAWRASRGRASMVEAAEAISWAGPRKGRAGRVFDLCLEILASEIGTPHAQAKDHQEALAHVHRARRRHFSRATRSVPKMLLIWAEGRLLLSLGITRMAVRRLATCLAGFEALGDWQRVGTAALDMAMALTSQGSEGRAERQLEITAAALRPREGFARQAAALERARSSLDWQTLQKQRALLAASEPRSPVPAALIPPTLVSSARRGGRFSGLVSRQEDRSGQEPAQSPSMARA